MNNKLVILIGLPGSGKTTWTREEALFSNGMKNEETIILYDNIRDFNFQNTVILRSDDIRVELFDGLNQNNNSLVFETMNKRCKEALKKGNHVIYDATNINRKRRVALINEMKRHCGIVSCICFICDFDIILERNLHRGNANVPKEALERMLKNFQMPLFNEGYTEITYKNSGAKTKYLSLTDDYFSNQSPLKDIKSKFKGLIYSIEDELLNYDQKNKHHNETLGEHIKSVIEQVYFDTENMKDYDRIILMLSAFYHDLGKPFCQEIKDDYATYRNHNYVSAYYMACDYMSDYNDKFKLIDIGNFILLDLIQLIEYHDFMFSYENLEQAEEKLKEKLGERIWYMLSILHKADRYRP